MKNEKVFSAISGYLMLLIVFVILAASITGLIMYESPWFIIGLASTKEP